MPQPETAGGGEPAIPAEDTNPATPFEDIANEMLGEDEERDDEPEADAPDEPDDEPEIEEEVDEPEAPAIDPPNSLTAEEKETFKSLPREAQEFTARRIGELEKGYNSKAQEAAQARQTAERDALQFAENLRAETAERLGQYAKMLEVQEPDIQLAMSDDPQDRALYAQQHNAHRYYTAQREQAQREQQEALAERDQYAAARQQHEAQAFRQQLEAELPEAFSEVNGQKIANDEFIGRIAATAKALGYDDNAISQSSVEELKALRTVAEWQAKAERFDKAMSKKMERVRSGKAPPPIARPGVARAPDQNRKARADQAWETAKTAKSRPAKDQALASWMENTGWI